MSLEEKLKAVNLRDLDLGFTFFVKHCHKCKEHETTTTRIWHQEHNFFKNFNIFCYFLSEYFPNSEVYGNPDVGDIPGFDKKCIINEFTIYLLGIDPYPDQPVILFSNRGKGSKWPNYGALYDQ